MSLGLHERDRGAPEGDEPAPTSGGRDGDDPRDTEPGSEPEPARLPIDSARRVELRAKGAPIACFACLRAINAASVVASVPHTCTPKGAPEPCESRVNRAAWLGHELYTTFCGCKARPGETCMRITGATKRADVTPPRKTFAPGRKTCTGCGSCGAIGCAIVEPVVSAVAGETQRWNEVATLSEDELNELEARDVSLRTGRELVP